MRRRLTLAALAHVVALSAFASEPVIDSVDVRTRAPHNPVVKVWYHVPKGYEPQGKSRHRVLVLFGGRNGDGRPEVSGKLGWTEWADLNGIFLVAPTLKDDDYWEPAKWSGRTLLDSLAALAARYRIATSGLLYYGYSAGSQASNLFPAWRPNLCRAYVSHACGVFHKPYAGMKNVAGLVTCGDADTARYVISRDFAYRNREAGGLLLWKPVKSGHELNSHALALAREFFAAVAAGAPCSLWGEDDTRQIKPCDRIDVEFLNPLYNSVVADLWRR